MENVQLGRKVLDYVTEHPKQFNMSTYGQTWSCGTVACLAGHAMLLAGYEMNRGGTYYRPDGSVVECESGEAAALLGLSEEERFPPDEFTIFSGHLSNNTAINRFREIVEKAEANQ